MTSSLSSFDWHCITSWKRSAKNTAWCLLGCSVGDNVTILSFQQFAPHTPMLIVMPIAVLMALIASISLETIILLKDLSLKPAIQLAFGMSFISMIMMETTANLINILFAGGDRLIITWWSLAPSLIVGFLSAWPYNYYKIKKYGKSCHSKAAH